MSKHGTIKRYMLIIEKTRKNHYPSFKEIKEYLFEHGFEISTRTIQRDIEQIRFEFGVEILYDRIKKGYYIDAEASVNFDSFLRFLEIVNTSELLIESLNKSKDLFNHISFESEGDFKGIENLKPLLFAVKNYRKIRFTHENFITGKHRNYSVRPYLLKEYQNRWYLVGTIGSSGEFRTFGIDRILNLEVREETFTPESKITPLELFKNTVGVNYSEGQVEDVVLSFTPLQAKYIKSLPLHNSQEIFEENDKSVLVRLRIIPNLEFKQKIMMFGETVTVLKPDWLAKDIQKSLLAALKNYK